jgi:hypothetical protein
MKSKAITARVSAADGFRHRTGVIRVDQQGALMKLECCSGEFTEDEHPIVVYSSRTVLLGYQVHPILQGGDQSDVGRPVVSQQLRSV